MQKLLKTLSIFIFTILLLIIGSVIWSFFNSYARVMLIPLGILSIYYLLLYSFIKLLNLKNTQGFYYVGLALILLPLLCVAAAYEEFISFSVQILNYFSRT